MRSRRPPKGGGLSLPIQLLHLLGAYPDSSGSILHGGRLVWRATVKPSALSDIYQVCIEAKPRSFPQVWVSGGAVDRCKDLPSVPHKLGYEERPPRVRVCLQYGDWSTDQLFTETVMPWCSEWILHFEIWMATDEWHGGGIHPS